jgi:serine/threonine protein kinase
VSIVPRLISATQHEPNSSPLPISSQGPGTGDSSDLFVAIRGYAEGDRIGGKYTLIDRLGEGGMGAVWRAHNELLEVDVALKLIRTDDVDMAEGTLMSDRLLQEARAAARLGHPAIARVFDYGTTERNHPYIVMELLKGEDLAEALARRGRVSNTKAVATLMPIAHALAAAHSQGIVHRDLKPENVFLARLEDGRVMPKLVDFGIAKMGTTGKSHRLTQTGTMLGSPIYMSPEQARGDEVDHRADVWAFCVVLYELVTGRPPFEGRNYNALLYAIIADEPRPLPMKAEGDEELWAILRKGFEKERDNRWSTIDELGRALAQWLIVRGVHEDISGASIVAQWLRALPAGDVLTSMLPAPVNFQMPVIPRRSDRAKWGAETRSLGPRSSRSGSSFQPSASAAAQSWLQLRDGVWVRLKLALADFAPLLRDPLFGAQRKWVLIGAGCSVVAGALAVAAALPGQTPPLGPTDAGVVTRDFGVRVTLGIEESDAVLSRAQPAASVPAEEVSTDEQPAASTNTNPVRAPAPSVRKNVGSQRKAPPTRLKNPFD